MSFGNKIIAGIGAFILYGLVVVDWLDKARKVYEAPGTALTLWGHVRRVFSDATPLATAIFVLGTICLAVATSDWWRPWVSRLAALVRAQQSVAGAKSVIRAAGHISPGSEGSPSRYFQIRVEADVDLVDCEVTVLRVVPIPKNRTEADYCEPLHCKWSWSGELKKSIPRGIPGHANVLKIVSIGADHPGALGLETRERPNYLSEVMQKPRQYRLLVDVRANSVDPWTGSFLLSWATFDSVTFDLESSLEPQAVRERA